jgi:hypothetical protein
VWWTLPPEPGHGPVLVLVLGVGPEHARVARVTAEGPGPSATGEAGAALALPPGTFGDGRGLGGVLDTGTVRRIALAAFRHRAGELDPRTWTEALRLTGGGRG